MANSLHATLVWEDQTLRDALVALDRGAVGIALVLDREERLVGTLTDGDVRRALLKGLILTAPLGPHVNRSFTSVSPEASRAEVLDLMQARVIEQIPILDERGRLRGLHLLHEILGRVERPNWAVIMAGGQGTRLRPITEHLPKPMIKVAGRPILERLVLHVIGYGIRRIFLAINYLGHMIEDYFGDGSRFGCQISYLREARPLGTGGALALLPERPSYSFLVLNGDLVTDANLANLFTFHDRGGHVATVGVRRYVHQVPFGCVEAEQDRLVRFEEKPALTRLVNTGIYVFEPAVLEHLPEGSFGLPALLAEAVDRGESVGVFQLSEEWLDVGQPEQLRQAREGT